LDVQPEQHRVGDRDPRAEQDLALDARGRGLRVRDQRQGQARTAASLPVNDDDRHDLFAGAPGHTNIFDNVGHFLHQSASTFLQPANGFPGTPAGVYDDRSYAFDWLGICHGLGPLSFLANMSCLDRLHPLPNHICCSTNAYDRPVSAA
jgi:hypothetical protein